MKSFAFLALPLALAGLVPLVAVACSSSDPGTGGMDKADAAVRDRQDPDVHVALEAGCGTVQIDSHPILPSPHVAAEAPLDYNSRPPSSGPHYAFWAAYRSYDAPVPPGYYVHSMEHGAVVILYRCDADGGSCASTVQAIEEAVRAIPDDRRCTPQVRVRRVVSPDPTLDVQVAAAAWGWTYRASCLDLPSLKAFLSEHYGQGDEDVCVDGITSF